MSLIVKDEEWAAELLAFENAIYEINTETKLEAPSSKSTRSIAIESYVQETSEMFDMVEMYLALLSSDLDYVNNKVQEIMNVDSAMASMTKLGS